MTSTARNDRGAFSSCTASSYLASHRIFGFVSSPPLTASVSSLQLSTRFLSPGWLLLSFPALLSVLFGCFEQQQHNMQGSRARTRTPPSTRKKRHQENNKKAIRRQREANSCVLFTLHPSVFISPLIFSLSSPSLTRHLSFLFLLAFLSDPSPPFYALLLFCL